ncbi:hypothetical protein BKCO1_7800036 [Neofusicoccum parvum]|uniref:Uncharacterized protein n=1 Tax=Neofusicoccum parvum TaxID=310453 RepID=A0ACB5SBM5_9PEZI|nr:hypothetical protein BKCO1_7800036 [Neofusicoccum parvum]
MQELRSIIAPIISSKSEVRSQYAKDLNQSLQALEIAHRHTDTQQIAQKPPGRTIISSADARNAASVRLKNISSALEAGNNHANPTKYPDWLLLEIEGNLLIRPHQVAVALATISPRSGRNSVLQMNMGQGKTSCIIPMVAAVLADARQLVRIVVPRTLLAQMAQVLQAQLGNLLDREVRSVPFSRRTQTTQASVDAFVGIYRAIMAGCGVMVTLPENILSFKLSGTQRLLDGRVEEARAML